MLVPIHCPECPGETRVYYAVPATVNGVYNFTCAKGHEVTAVTQEPNYSVLFEIALNAIADGYHREAVASGTAAMERFFEFAFRVIQKKLGTEPEQVSKAWAHVRKSSERQIGIFVASYLSVFREVPELMAPDAKKPAPAASSVSFRNKVIHDGLIPTREEAIDYTSEVLRLCKQILQKLKLEAYGEVCEVTYEEQNRNHAEVKFDGTTLWMGLGALLDPLLLPTYPALSVEEKIEYYARHRSEVRR
jgi:hypothetical protein